jgi:hypothetical protein
MSVPVDPDVIEQIVGVDRHPFLHFGRAVSAERMVYILHSQACKDFESDLADCPYSLALDRGIDESAWEQDRAVPLQINAGWLTPREVPLV